MPSGRASRSSNRVRWTGCPSAIAAGLRADRHKGIGAAAGHPRATDPTEAVHALAAVPRGSANPRASRGCRDKLSRKPCPGSNEEGRRHHPTGLGKVGAHALLKRVDLDLLGTGDPQRFELRN